MSEVTRLEACGICGELTVCDWEKMPATVGKGEPVCTKCVRELQESWTDDDDE